MIGANRAPESAMSIANMVKSIVNMVKQFVSQRRRMTKTVTKTQTTRSVTTTSCSASRARRSLSSCSRGELYFSSVVTPPHDVLLFLQDSHARCKNTRHRQRRQKCQQLESTKVKRSKNQTQGMRSWTDRRKRKWRTCCTCTCTYHHDRILAVDNRVCT